MNKDYQTTAPAATAAAVPEQVSIAIEEIAADMREGLLALAVGDGLQVMHHLTEAIKAGVPTVLSEVLALERPLKRRAADMLASPTMSPNAWSTPADSGLDYTPDCEGPPNRVKCPG